MPFVVGDIVKFLNESGGGVVVKVLDDNHVLVKDDHGFEYKMTNADLVSEGKNAVNHKMIQIKLNQVDDKAIREKEPSHHLVSHSAMVDYVLKSKSHWTRKDKDFIEVDLHLEMIHPGHKQMTDGQKLDYQLNYARECLESAVDMNLRKVVFIHGIGKGVLKHELTSWLKSRVDCEIIPGDYQRYGMGATAVIIRGLHS